jgi:GT2 family glycosyltransferase
VIATFRKRSMLVECLVSVQTALDYTAESSELIVVDDGSDDGTSRLVADRFPEVRLLRIPENVGFAPAVSRGIVAADGTWVGLLNDDATVDQDAYARMLAAVQGRPDVGAVGAQIRFAGNRRLINSAGIVIDRWGVGADRLIGAPIEASESKTVEVFGTSAGAAIYRASMLKELGGFDESFYAYLEDVDLAWRARMMGWRTLYEPRAVVYHHHSMTLKHGSPRKYYLVGRNRVRMLAKNADRRLLIRYGPAMIAYDLAYVGYVALRDRTLAPLRGRVSGLRDWRRYRRAHAAGRRHVELAPAAGLRAALRRNRALTLGKPPP